MASAKGSSTSRKSRAKVTAGREVTKSKEASVAKAAAKVTPAVKVSPVKATPAADAPPSHELIAKRAYEIWMGKGCPQNTADEDWQEAMQQLGV